MAVCAEMFPSIEVLYNGITCGTGMVNAQGHPARPVPSRIPFCRYDNAFCNYFFISLTMIGSPVGHPFFKNIVLVCVDCEGWHSNSQIRTSEIGVTLLETRILHDVSIID